MPCCDKQVELLRSQVSNLHLEKYGNRVTELHTQCSIALQESGFDNIQPEDISNVEKRSDGVVVAYVEYYRPYVYEQNRPDGTVRRTTTWKGRVVEYHIDPEELTIMVRDPYA
ncbi:hypothetical protein [Vibrio phage RYC]|nr:hypothetical protein [Vibrio phage RYC]